MTDLSLPAAIGCAPVDPNQYGGPRLSIWNGIKASGLPAPPFYPGSVYATCDECAIQIIVGPRQQEALEAAGRQGVEVTKLCLVCAAITRSGSVVANLGNPYQPRR